MYCVDSERNGILILDAKIAMVSVVFAGFVNRAWVIRFGFMSKISGSIRAY